MGFNVVVLESDPSVAQYLAARLASQFPAVHFTRSSDELRERVANSHPEAVVVDMENSRLTDVRNLHRDFPALPIVCTHRHADDRLWIEAMEAGASDVCRADDIQKVLKSVLRDRKTTKGAAA